MHVANYSYYGCELWSLSNSNVNEFCVACMAEELATRVRDLPFQSQFIALHGLHTRIVVHFMDGMWYFVLSGSTVPLRIGL